jgi:hypothetical protein
MHFIKLTLANNETTLVNMDLVYEVRIGKHKALKGSQLYFSTGGEGDSIFVHESQEEILGKCES